MQDGAIRQHAMNAWNKMDYADRAAWNQNFERYLDYIMLQVSGYPVK